MKPRRGMTVLYAACALTVGCKSNSAESSARGAAIAQESFAVVGSKQLHRSLLRPFAAHARPDAVEPIVRDALLWVGADERVPSLARSAHRGVLARAVLERLQAKALAQGAISETERKAAEDRLWLQLNRPRAVRTAFIFIEVPPLADDAEEYALAQDIRQAVEGSPTLEAFAQAAQSVIKDPDRTVAFGHRPPVAADGRIVPIAPSDTAETPIEHPYAKAASELTHIGEVADVVATEEGFYVIVATDVVPPREARPKERLKLVERAVAEKRGQRLLEELKSRAKERTEVQLNPNHENLTRLPWRER